jgi:C-1 hydroxylase
MRRRRGKFANFLDRVGINKPSVATPRDRRPTMSTTAEPVHNATLKANKAVVKSFVEAWNTRDLDRFDALMGEHAVLRIGGGVVPCDPAGTRAIAVEWTRAFPDYQFELLTLIAEADLVVAHMPYSGTFREAILGLAPTGRSCTVDEIVIFRIADGKIAEAWEVYDEAGMWRQLGVAP